MATLQRRQQTYSGVLPQPRTLEVEELALARTAGTYLQWHERLVRPSVLVVDNFGSRKLVAMEAQDLCEILDARAGERSMVITSLAGGPRRPTHRRCHPRSPRAHLLETVERLGWEDDLPF